MSKEHPVVLLVDDEQDILNIYVPKLTEAGYEVVTAMNGSEAIALAKEKLPDLILMDVKMPVMDGVDAAIRLKEDPATRDLKIVFITAFSDPTKPEIDAKFAKELGALDFITKGLSLDEFIVKVAQFLK